MDQAAKGAVPLIVIIEGVQASVSYRDSRYHFPDITELSDGPLMRGFCGRLEFAPNRS